MTDKTDKTDAVTITSYTWDKNLERLVEKATDTSDRLVPRKWKQRHNFLKGPIPLSWLKVACSLPGKVPNMALAIWYARGLTRSNTFKLKSSALKTFGITHPGVYHRAVAALEGAGLIAVERKPGQLLIITVLEKVAPAEDVPTEEEGDGIPEV